MGAVQKICKRTEHQAQLSRGQPQQDGCSGAQGALELGLGYLGMNAT